MQSTMLMRKASVSRPVLPARRSVAPLTRCQAQKPHDEEAPKASNALLASMVAAALLAGAFSPEEALAARSSGRAGGSTGFSSRKMSRAAPAPAPAQSYSRTTVVAPSVVVAPAPVFSPFGGFGYGGFGYGFGMPIGIPIFGGIFQLFFLMIMVSVVFAVVRAFASNASKGNSKDKDDDSWGNL